MSDLVSRPATIEDLKKIIKSLNDNGVDYLLIGGYSLHAHGYIRSTSDIDILVPADKKVGEKLKRALLVLPDKCAKDIDLKWFNGKEGTIRVADEVVVDIMFNACGHTYDELKKYEEIVVFENIPIRTINLEGLYLTKQTLRDKDVADRNLLAKVLTELKKDNN